MGDLIQEFATLFAVIDPIGTVPVFLAVSASIAAERRRAVALRAVGIAGLVLLLFIVVGQVFLELIGITLVSFQIAGGIVLFLFGLSMIFGTSKPESEMGLVERSNAELAVYPLAIPSIAGPGSILTVVLLTDNRANPMLEQVLTTAMLAIVLCIVLALLLLANGIHRLIGNAGAAIISRIMGLIITAVAVETILTGISLRFGL